MSFGDLKTKIQSWINREDAEFVAMIPQFIRLAETDIYASLRCPHNEFSITYADGESASGAHTLLPSNFREVKLLTWNGKPLDPVSDHELSVRLAAQYDLEPDCYTLIARQLKVSAALDDDPANWEGGVLVLSYWGTESLNDLPVYQTPTNPVDSVPTEATETAISQSDDNTTRLYQHAPGLYLDGCLYYALKWLKKYDEAAIYRGGFQEGLARLLAESKRGEYAGAPRGINAAYGE